jgi:hypothetical protein
MKIPAGLTDLQLSITCDTVFSAQKLIRIMPGMRLNPAFTARM